MSRFEFLTLTDDNAGWEDVMVRMLTTVLLCIVCWSTTPARFNPPQDPQPFAQIDFRVKGVGLGSSHALVLRRLGRPISSKREKIPDHYGICGGSYTSLRLRYQGVEIELMGDLRGRDFQVMSMEVTSSKFLIAPGLRIGMTEEEMRSKIGAPFQEKTESGFRILNYVTKDNEGGAGLYIRDGRLVKVQWDYVMC